MCFTQLPSKTKVSFRNDYRVNVELELALTPRIKTVREHPEIPEDTSVALALFIEKFIRGNESVGSPETLEGAFIQGDFNVRYKRIPGGRDDIFLAFPKEKARTRIKRLGKSYQIIGESSYCNGGWSRPVSPKASESVLERLISVRDDIWRSKHTDVDGSEAQSDFSEFTFGRDQMFAAMTGLESTESPRCMEGWFRGLCRVRTRFGHQHSELCILYPLFLERIERV